MTEMLKLNVHDFYSPDVDLHSWEPASLEAVKLLIELEIGEVGDERTDLFQVVVATPEGLRRAARGSIIAERATLVLAEYSWPRLRAALDAIVDRCAAPTWEASVLRLQRYFQWEYEDHVMEA